MAKKLRGFFIFEMLGRPPKHLESTLSQFVDKISKEEDLEVFNQKINKPKKVEKAEEEIYTSFAETEIEFKDISALFKLIFVYMPSHIEITEPEEISIKNFDFSSLMNELTRKLHKYDEIAKRITIERNILLKRLQKAGVSLQDLQKEQENKGKKVKKKNPSKNKRKNK